MWKVVYKVVPTFPVYLSSPRNLPPMPHPTHISLPPSSPYPLPQLSTINWFISGRSWSCIVRSDTKWMSFLVGFLGTTRNKVISFRVSEKRETTKVVSTIFAMMFYFSLAKRWRQEQQQRHWQIVPLTISP